MVCAGPVCIRKYSILIGTVQRHPNMHVLHVHLFLVDESQDGQGPLCIHQLQRGTSRPHHHSYERQSLLSVLSLFFFSQPPLTHAKIRR